MKDIEKLVNKRLSIVCVIFSLIGAPIVFLFGEYNRPFILFLWLIWVIIGILLSPKIARKIWKN